MSRDLGLIIRPTDNEGRCVIYKQTIHDGNRVEEVVGHAMARPSSTVGYVNIISTELPVLRVPADWVAEIANVTNTPDPRYTPNGRVRDWHMVE